MEFNGIANVKAHLKNVRDGYGKLNIEECLNKLDLQERYFLAYDSNKSVSWADVCTNPDKYENLNEHQERMFNAAKGIDK